MFSPCINAGLNQPWMNDAVDLEGGPRIMQGIVDMGSFEYAYGFLSISGMGVQSRTNFCLQAWGTPGATCVLQASTNLVNWVTLTNVGVGISRLLDFMDRDMRTYPHRFYRALQWPPGTVYFSAPSGEITPPFVASGGYIYQPTETGIADAGRAAYSFTIANAGTYVIQAMVEAPGGGANSFFVNVDAEPQDPAMIWDIMPYTAGFEARLVSWRGGGTFDSNQFAPKVFTLAPGAHQLIVRGREGHTLLQDMAIVPYPAVYIPLTPETVVAPFILTNNYLYQPFETGVADGGLAAYSFVITIPGNYAIRAVVNAPDGSANSFFVNLDAEPQDPYMIWDVPITAGFEQREVSWRGNGTFDNNEFVPKVFNLAQGPHQLVIRGREGYTLLQSITILQMP